MTPVFALCGLAPDCLIGNQWFGRVDCLMSLIGQWGNALSSPSPRFCGPGAHTKLCVGLTRWAITCGPNNDYVNHMVFIVKCFFFEFIHSNVSLLKNS